MKISACVIVRDEEQNVGCWLDNMSKVADELVVVDAGSKDRTVELIREYGIEPHFFAWCDDFAAAKNYAISKATGDWILFLDADEYFADGEKGNAVYHYGKRQQRGDDFYICCIGYGIL